MNRNIPNLARRVYSGTPRMQQLRYGSVRCSSSHVTVSNEKQPEDADASPFVSQIVVNGKHHMLGDEPAENGGKDEGPSPYDLLLSGLGCCTAMTLRMYASHKNLPLTGVKVDLSHSKYLWDELDKAAQEKAADSSPPSGKKVKYDKIERRISVLGDLQDKERKRLLEIANMCPVHRTLSGGQVIILSSLVEEE